MKHRFVASSLLLFGLCLCFAGGCASDVPPKQPDAARQKELALQKELDETKAFLARQDQQNQELVQQQALWQKRLDEQRREQIQTNDGLLAAHTQLQSRYDELKSKYDETKLATQTQTVSFRKVPSVTIVPNNSLIDTELNFDDPEILPVRRDGSDLVIELQDRLLFEPDGPNRYTDKLSQSGKQRLRKVADEISRCYPNDVYCIVGHLDESIADERGMDMSLQYSLQKAAAVSNWLVGEVGINSSRLQVGAEGATRPITANISPANHERNRRVEWIIRAGLNAER
ncbi:MAG: OmpA family protein [Thermoguttaceae bacterium]|nr:OmpA family protein [Thermoguttaceae bacterium]